MYTHNLVSIIMPSYNCSKIIAETIDSVLRQTYPLWELIIVDDCSTDNTIEVLEEYANIDSRIRFHKLNENSGAAVSRSVGIEQATGEYIAFLDSDDIWVDNKLEKQIEFMKKNDCAFTFTAYEIIDEEGKTTDEIVYVKEKVDYNRVLKSNPIGNSTVIYSAKKLGKFTVPNIKKRNDLALWLQILKKEKYAVGINEVLMQYRVRKNSISRNKFSLMKYHWILFREIEQLSLFKSVLHIFFWVFYKILKLDRGCTR